MNLVRISFVALALLVPTSWTIARAADEPPAGDKSGETKSGTKSKKSSKKSKKKSEGSTDTKSDEPAK
jgi:hypothetical protein